MIPFLSKMLFLKVILAKAMVLRQRNLFGVRVARKDEGPLPSARSVEVEVAAAFNIAACAKPLEPHEKGGFHPVKRADGERFFSPKKKRPATDLEKTNGGGKKPMVVGTPLVALADTRRTQAGARLERRATRKSKAGLAMMK